jgi:hypothetical protein
LCPRQQDNGGGLENQNNMKRALVVGGIASYVHNTLSGKLAKYGCVVAEHRPAGTVNLNPGGIHKFDVVVVLYMEVPEKKYTKAWEEACQTQKVPCLKLDRQESRWGREFERNGIKTINPVAAAVVMDKVIEPKEETVAPPNQTMKQEQPPEDTPEGIMTQLQVLLLQLKDQGVCEMKWSADGLRLESYEVMVRKKVLIPK